MDGTGLTTNPIYIQDLAVWLPALTIVAVLLWQRRPSGVFLAGAGLFFWTIEAIGVAVDQWFGHRADPTSDVATLAGAVLFVVLAAVTLVPLSLWVRAVKQEHLRPAAGHAPARAVQRVWLPCGGGADGGARRWAVRLVVMALRLVVVAVGVGLGPRHFAEEGLRLPAITGFLLLAVGLVASVWSAIRVLAAARRRWWAPVVALMLTATCLVLWTLGQAVAGSYAPRPALGRQTPASFGLAYLDVALSSSDGTDLAGWYIPTRNGAAVALMHGAGSTRSGVLEHAAVLAGNGFGVLLFDARGHGESAGRAMDFGWYGESDAFGAVDFLTQQHGVSPGRIGLVGMSMGGEQAIGAAGVDERVAAVVAEGATNRVAADKGYLDAYGGSR